MLSVIRDLSLYYPDGDDFYSPDEAFPEYRHGHLASRPNPVYRAVRQCFAQAGLDSAHCGTAAWNPLGDLVPPGSQVFVLCNFVLNRHPRENAEAFSAKCLNASILRAVVDYLLLAVGAAGIVRFGNSPMQHADWTALLRETGADKVIDFYRARSIPVEARDLRLFVVRRNRAGATVHFERRPDHGGVPVDLGCDSLLADLDSTSATKYRIMNYSSSRLHECHGPHRHVYLINREILDADVVFSLPKLKTHEKTGITCIMKNCVGTVGHKDSLPHYRFGCPEIGGDEYPKDGTGLLRLASAFHGRVQSTRHGTAIGNAARVADKALRIALGRFAPISEGGWWGNDTTWRMVVDLARAVSYTDKEGRLQPERTRKHLALVDGIVAGEGWGPLSPSPVRTGIVLLADNPLVGDYASALLMGFDPRCLPTVSRAAGMDSYPLFTGEIIRESAIYNGKPISLAQLASLNDYHFQPPPGWEGML